MPLSISELTAARDFLRQAETLVSACRALFRAGGDHATAARLKRIADHIEDEIAAVERRIP